MSDDTHVLFQGLESRQSKSGKTRFTIRVESEALVFNTDPKTLGRPIAEAIVHHFRERIKGITAKVAENTLRARETERRAYAAGKAWATKRYAGGRTGATPPLDSDRAFNHSGRFAATITGNASSDGAWRINVAANRLDEKTGRIERIWTRLVQLVPEFANPAMLMENDMLRKSMERAMKDAVKKLPSSTEVAIGKVRALFDLGRAVADLVA